MSGFLCRHGKVVVCYGQVMWIACLFAFCAVPVFACVVMELPVVCEFSSGCLQNHLRVGLMRGKEGDDYVAVSEVVDGGLEAEGVGFASEV